ncbi:MAG: peptidoglycan DD-metalloendopeptidase family protein [Patescibacteria group bacterium]
MLRIYLFYFSVKKSISTFISRSHNIVHNIVNKKVTIYSLVTILLMLILTQNISAQEKTSEELGRDSIIFSLFAEEAGVVIIEDSAPATQTQTFTPETDIAIKSEQAATPTQEAPEQEFIENTTTVTMGGLALTTTNDLSTPHTRTGIEKYTVQGGDTVTSIAKQFNISVNSILWANNLSSFSIIRPGDTLNILPFSGIVHIIAEGDTIQTLAGKYQATENDIITTNNFDTDEVLAIGSQILIPGGVKPQPKPAPVTTPAATVSRIARETTVPPPQDSDADLLWPANSHRINQYYHWRHRALDIDGSVGDPVYSSEDGVVEISGWNNNGYGYYVVIDHGNGIKTLYAHNVENVVARGDKVSRGDLIAYIGSTGRSTGPHIHYEVRVNGSAVNPLLYTE